MHEQRFPQSLVSCYLCKSLSDPSPEDFSAPLKSRNVRAFRNIVSNHSEDIFNFSVNVIFLKGIIHCTVQQA